MIKADLKKVSVKKAKSFRAEHSEHSNFWMTTVSIPQMPKVSKIITKTSSKLKNDIKKFDSISTSSDPFFKIIVKCICQNHASAKGGFAGWLKVSNHKLHRLMLWDSEKNTKRQKLQRKLFERDISFMIKILKENIKNKAELLVNLTKIRKHYPSAYVMCQILMSVTNTEIPFTDWDTLFKLTINKHRNRIQHNLQYMNKAAKILINTEKNKTWYYWNYFSCTLSGFEEIKHEVPLKVNKKENQWALKQKWSIIIICII